MVFFVLIDLLMILLCWFHPLVQLISGIIIMLKIDGFKLFYNIYFPQSSVIYVDESHYDELVIVKLPLIVFCTMSFLRLIKKQIRDIIAFNNTISGNKLTNEWYYMITCSKNVERCLKADSATAWRPMPFLLDLPNYNYILVHFQHVLR